MNGTFIIFQIWFFSLSTLIKKSLNLAVSVYVFDFDLCYEYISWYHTECVSAGYSALFTVNLGF